MFVIQTNFCWDLFTYRWQERAGNLEFYPEICHWFIQRANVRLLSAAIVGFRRQHYFASCKHVYKLSETTAVAWIWLWPFRFGVCEWFFWLLLNDYMSNTYCVSTLPIQQCIPFIFLKHKWISLYAFIKATTLNNVHTFSTRITASAHNQYSARWERTTAKAVHLVYLVKTFDG